jgi:hypothetical protein
MNFMSQGNSLCNYLKQTKMSLFSFTKLENRRVEQIHGGVVREGGMVSVGRGRRWEKSMGG